MAGGYLKSDREFGMTDVYPAFRFTRWHLIDIFIYFSHHFVTLPPLSWINLAHRQGVRVYGTLIFESYDEKFQAIFVEDENLDSFNHFKLAHKLDQIRRLSGFEGWLMNFEITLPEAIVKKTVGRILNFLRLLKNLGSEVIWYDSLTLSGKLKYQNALTGENKAFLDTGIDGIFLNYNWNDELLERSQDTAGSANNSSRVFVGVDCFGRGCPGGGGFGTPVALNMILNAMRNKFTFMGVSTYHTAKLLAKTPLTHCLSSLRYRNDAQIVRCLSHCLLRDGLLKSAICPVQAEIRAKCTASSLIGMIDSGLHWLIFYRSFEVKP
ncbi:Cytosolic endo-beta-N-acetylglucosaminidase [Fasciola gigantica]|uniref:Cytosolic endo-beta-N-acetylglucosaminidase n=1 Tax=Fasciola gigantica TaxID=46835 RepID=A0A504YZB6_FASGI|nr:Cytosolic endo-beta-N-acetylglucosaminidase [Fasciola gigantica]